MTSSKINKLPVFPLGLVVLPGTIQTLQIFEPRYLSMVKNCMSADTGFVITLSKNNQSGESFMSQGTFVEIIDFNQLPNGLLGITVRGSQKVSIKSVEQLESGLHYASIAPVAEPAVDDQAVLAQFPELINVLSQLKEHP
ncbi:LON peptidase substrate-binding domain-containing protein, partial [Gammaproteobacteria bacterium]|nr:LON peptidase substrate-binding domain-containing protein [Gammaproteobacteria bacterium]